MKIIFLILVIFLVLLISCNESTSTIENKISIEFVSVQNGDSLNPGAGVIIRFSDAVKLNSFNAQRIDDIYFVDYFDSSQFIKYPVETKIYRLQSSQNVLLNGEPQSFWYDPLNYEIALFEETTISEPSGTGHGLIIDQNNLQLIIKADIVSENGSNLDEEFQLTINHANSTYQLRVVQNPILLTSDSIGLEIIIPPVNFTHLPDICEINIYDHNNNLIQTIQHDSDGVEPWNLTRNDSLMIEPGIYQFEIVDNSNIISGGVFVFPAKE